MLVDSVENATKLFIGQVLDDQIDAEPQLKVADQHYPEKGLVA